MAKQIKTRLRKDGRWEADCGKQLGVRRRFVRSSKQEAERDAKSFMAELRNGRAGFTPDQIIDASQAYQILRQNEIATSLVTVVAEWMSSRVAATEMTLADAVDARIAAMQERNLRPRSILSASSRLKRFAAYASRTGKIGPVRFVTTAHIVEFIGPFAEPVTKLGHLRDLSAFFEFCIRRGWCMANPCKALDRPVVDHKMPVFMNAYDVAMLMRAAFDHDPAMAIVPALGFFAGLRPDEIRRLRAEDYERHHNSIRVRPEASKVRRSRLVQSEPNLAAWIDACDLTDNDEFPALCKRFDAWRRSQKIAWHPDIMRHTFATMHYAVHQDLAGLAAQMGNSSEVILKHYRGLATEAEAREFWAIVPPTKETA